MNTFYKFTIGEFRFIALEDAQKDIDLRDEFVQVDQEELLLALKTNGQEEFIANVGFNCLLVQNNNQYILIDAGSGKDNLASNLKAVGIELGQIDIIIVTHSDFDHIGGLEKFPNARIIFPKQAYDLWTNKKSRKEMIENYRSIFMKFLPMEIVNKGVAYREYYGSTLLPNLKDKITLVEAEEEFIPGIRMIFAPGHRADHYAVEVTTGVKSLLHIADGFRHAIQVAHPEWYSRVDSYPKLMEESLKMLVQRAEVKDAILFGSHFSFPGLAKIKSGKMKMTLP